MKIAFLGNDAGIIGAALLWKDDISSTPISIIITTLVASAYNNETDLYSALSNILQNMPKFIKKDGNRYIIENMIMVDMSREKLANYRRVINNYCADLDLQYDVDEQIENAHKLIDAIKSYVSEIK